jgi:hypothetical protein
MLVKLRQRRLHWLVLAFFLLAQPCLRAVELRKETAEAFDKYISSLNGERELPVGKDRGLLWRLYGYWLYEERDGGVIVECESVTLTRDVTCYRPSCMASPPNPCAKAWKPPAAQ